MHAVKTTERFYDPMEHRWGRRSTFEVPVKLTVNGRKLGRGLLRNSSISGALIETALELPVFSNLVVSIPAVGDRSSRTCDLAASVVRSEPGRLAVEWRDMACPSIVALLERITGQCATELVQDEAFTKGKKLLLTHGGSMQRFDPAYDETKETFVSIDKDGSGNIEFDEFMGLMLKIDHSRSEGALRVQFAAIDANHDGRISEEELRAWLCIDGR